MRAGYQMWSFFDKCKIRGTKRFLKQSQLRWAGHVIRMGDERNPYVVMHSRLDSGHMEMLRWANESSLKYGINLNRERYTIGI